MAYVPEFEIDNEMLALVSDISVLSDRIMERDFPSRQLELRRTNRIKSIQSSLAIEGNTLSLEKVTDIIDGKKVIGSPREIQEVKGAIEAYDLITDLDPYSVKDILIAHGKMMQGLVVNPGRFRDCNVGVYKGSVPVHIAPEFGDVPQLMDELMQWAKRSDAHPLIKGCIFHCRFEYIHPFVDGNGRIGRLWHSLILSKWMPIFAYLPIESWIKLNQREYYNVLTEADDGNVAEFIRFMLRMIFAATDELTDYLE